MPANASVHGTSSQMATLAGFPDALDILWKSSSMVAMAVIART